MVTAPHTPVPFSPVLEDAYVPNADRIVSTVKSMLR
jgi:pyruvate/2-oxoglutarate/acetoin dehydrogenase E1 component